MAKKKGYREGIRINGYISQRQARNKAPTRTLVRMSANLAQRNATTVKKSDTKPLHARKRKYMRDVRKKATTIVVAAK